VVYLSAVSNLLGLAELFIEAAKYDIDALRHTAATLFCDVRRRVWVAPGSIIKTLFTGLYNGAANICGVRLLDILSFWLGYDATL